MEKSINYISPEIKVMEIMTEGLLCLSQGTGGGESFPVPDEIPGWFNG